MTKPLTPEQKASKRSSKTHNSKPTNTQKEVKEYQTEGEIAEQQQARFQQDIGTVLQNQYEEKQLELPPEVIQTAPELTVQTHDSAAVMIAKEALKIAPSRSNIGLGVPEAMADEDRFRVIITGRGQSHGRISALMRLSPVVVAEIKTLVDGPLYLTVELALRHYANVLRSRPPGDIELIKAADLG